MDSSDPRPKPADPQTPSNPSTATQGQLSRRHLLGAGIGIAAGSSLLACTPSPYRDDPSAGSPTGSGAAEVPAFELTEVSTRELLDGMASGRWSSEQVTRLYLERIDAVDRSGPTLRSVIETNPEALEIAAALDQERRDGRLRGLLHGVPILVKDNIATHDRMTTTAGSLALEGSIPPEDATVARRLRDHGAVILGKANLSEWANFRSTRSSSGWSGRGGQCKNPYALDRNPCGSSSGSGAAASASLCAAAVGTETNGSIVCPSHANGLVGLKPTVALVPQDGIIPISHTQDTAGPMGRTVEDVARLFLALADPAGEGLAEAGDDPQAFLASLDPGALQGTRIGVARNRFGFDPEVDQLMEAALQAVQDAGAEIVDETEPPTYGDFEGATFEVLLYEFKAGLNAYLAALGPEAPVKTLEEVIAFNDAHAQTSLPYFGQEILLQAQEKGPLSDPDYTKALETCRRISRTEGLDKLFAEHHLDAIVAPTGSPAWPTDLVNGDHFIAASSTPAAVSGYPNITVPAGFVFGLPVGLSWIGNRATDLKLLRLAYAFEQATQQRRAPRFLPTLELGG